MQPLTILHRYFGHSTFRGQQLHVIERVIKGGHSLVIMPTGMGKSLCYQIPAILLASQDQIVDDHDAPRRGLTLVISPLIALMKDQVDSLCARGISASYINSSLSRGERETRYTSVGRGDYDLLYVTPERFRKQQFVARIRRRRVNLLAVDEAHCISEWGHDFRPDYTRLWEIRQLLNGPTTIALTATATPEVQSDIIGQLGLPNSDVEIFHEGIDRPNLRLKVIELWGDEEKLDHIIGIRQSLPGSGIVYFTLIKTLMRFSAYLQMRDVSHLIYHGELEARARRSIQDRFMNESDQLVLATSAFGMGIDKHEIRFVVHADIPGSMESYYQQIGRAGRDGLPSECVLLYDQHDLETQMEFLRWSNPNTEFYERVVDLLHHDRERVQAYGLEWLREKLHDKGKFDHRLETALGILERYGVIEGSFSPFDFEVVGDLPRRLRDQSGLDEKRRRDLKQLYMLVQYAKCKGDRKAFIRAYFGLLK